MELLAKIFKKSKDESCCDIKFEVIKGDQQDCCDVKIEEVKSNSSTCCN